MGHEGGRNSVLRYPVWGKKEFSSPMRIKTKKQKGLRLHSETFTKNTSKWKAESCYKIHSPKLNSLSLNLSANAYRLCVLAQDAQLL